MAPCSSFTNELCPICSPYVAHIFVPATYLSWMSSLRLLTYLCCDLNPSRCLLVSCKASCLASFLIVFSIFFAISSMRYPLYLLGSLALLISLYLVHRLHPSYYV